MCTALLGTRKAFDRPLLPLLCTVDFLTTRLAPVFLPNASRAAAAREALAHAMGKSTRPPQPARLLIRQVFSEEQSES